MCTSRFTPLLIQTLAYFTATAKIITVVAVASFRFFNDKGHFKLALKPLFLSKVAHLLGMFNSQHALTVLF